MGILSVVIVIHWVLTSPAMGTPPGLANLDGDKAKVLVETIKSLSEVATDRSTKMFQVMIAGSLLPVLTALG